MTVFDPLATPSVTIPADVIVDVCLRAYLAFDGVPATITHDLGNGHMIVGHAYSLGQMVTVDYEIVSTG